MDCEQNLIVCLILFLAGAVKGVVGFGVPTISLAILLTMGYHENIWPVIAIACFFTNIWQALSGPYLVELFEKLYFFLMVSFVTTFSVNLMFGAQHPDLSKLILGITICLYLGFRFFARNVTLSVSHHYSSTTMIGFAQGAVTGISGSFLLPVVPFMQLLMDEREKYIQALGVVFCNMAIALSCSLVIKGDFTQSVSALCIAGSVAALSGMHFGKIYRRKMPKAHFEKAVLTTMLVVGVILIAKFFGATALSHATDISIHTESIPALHPI